MMDKYLIKCYRNAVRKTKILTVEEERVICEKVKSGDKVALKKLIESSLRTVWNIAIKYSSVDVDVFDLIQEGNLGLIRAAESFDPSEGTRFNTYAIFWIRQKIQRYYHEKSRLIRLPVHKETTAHKINQFSERFCEEFQRLPSTEEIAAGIGKDVSFVSNLRLDSASCYSLDYICADHGSDSPSFLTIKDDHHNPERVCCEECDKALLYQAIDTLSDRDKEIMKLRFGFYDREYTLMEVAEKNGLSHESIRTIQRKCLEKMKGFYLSKNIKNI